MKGLLLALAVALAGLAPASAQTPAKPAEKGAAPAAPAAIRRAETIVDDNWTVSCAETGDAQAKRVCSAALRIAQADKSGGQRVVFAWVLGRQEGKLTSAISVPTGVQIPPGMEIRIGDKEARKVGYSACMPDHCEALLPLEDTLVKSLGAAQTVAITIRAINGAEAKFTVNMKGFTQALADIGK